MCIEECSRLTTLLQIRPKKLSQVFYSQCLTQQVNNDQTRIDSGMVRKLHNTHQYHETVAEVQNANTKPYIRA